MTADHPTREERIMAVIEAHETWEDGECVIRCACGSKFYPDQKAAHRAHVAAALVAADPAPAQPECDGSGSCPAPLHIHGCFADTDDARCDDPEGHAPAQPDAGRGRYEACVMDAEGNCRRWAHSHPPAEPVAALSDEERETLGDWWDSDWPNDAALTTLYAAVERIIVERAIQTIPEWQYAPFGVREPYNAEDSAAQPVPAPEVSRGVAEVKAEALREAADEWPEDLSRGEAQRWLHAHADRIVRGAHPADDGADCCRERTTAGGCNCKDLP